MNKNGIVKFIFIFFNISILFKSKKSNSYFKSLIKKNKANSYFNNSFIEQNILNSNLESNINILKSNLTSNKSRNFKQFIPIAYALNEGYFYPTFISLISLLENSNKSCCYVIYLLLSADGSFPEYYIKKYKDLEYKYINCEIIFIDIDEDIYQKASTKRYPKSTYYRLLIADIVTDYDRIIYLDGDTIVFNDLTELMNLEMKNNIVMGWLDNGFGKTKAEEFNITIKAYITAGVILFNIKKMREENITDKFFNFMNKYYYKLYQEDQTIINLVLYDRIGYLPPKYGIWTYNKVEDLIHHNHFLNKSSPIKCYDDLELIDALNDPGIAHYVRSKPWKPISKFTCLRYRKIWWDYAKLSGEYENIKELYDIDN